MIEHLPIASAALHIGGFQWTGDFTTVDLIAASTNSLNGALLARRPDHYKNFTVVGIMLMALLMGLGGGITRDVLVDQVPGALTNPAYIVLALAFGAVGYLIAYTGGQLFREGLFQFMTSFSLPWYAIVGAQKGVTVGLPVLGCLLLAVVGPTAGRWYIDVTSGVPPKQFIRGEWFVAIAALTGLVWMLATWARRLGTWWAAGSRSSIGFTVRVIALYRGWEEPLAKEPKGVYQHDDGRPLLGRKLAGKSQRELRRPRPEPSTRTRKRTTTRRRNGQPRIPLPPDRNRSPRVARAAKADVAGRAVRCVALSGSDPVAPAVGGMAEVGPALLELEVPLAGPCGSWSRSLVRNPGSNQSATHSQTLPVTLWSP